MSSRPKQNIDITISIVNWNTKDELAECLESVFHQEGVRFEVIVVDNASEDGSAEMVKARWPKNIGWPRTSMSGAAPPDDPGHDARGHLEGLIENDDNLGFAAAQNQALKASNGRYALMLNPDARIVEPDALAKVVAFADSEPEVGIIGLRVLNIDGTLQFSARRFPTLGAAFFRNTFLGRLFPKNKYVKDYLMTDWAHDEVRDVDWVSGAAMVIRRETLENVGYLDEQFFMYVEDVDFCLRAHENGWRVSYFPRSTVIHRIAASSDLAQVRMIYLFHKSMRLFFEKHYAKSWPIHTRLLALAGLGARMVSFIALNVLKRALGKGR